MSQHAADSLCFNLDVYVQEEMKAFLLGGKSKQVTVLFRLLVDLILGGS